MTTPNSIQYTLPAGTPDSFASTALALLVDIEFSAPDFYAEFLRSDIVLTLSGVRAMNANLTLSSYIEDGRQTAQLRKVLSSHNIELITFGNEQILINIEALENLPMAYPILSWPESPSELTPDLFREWITALTYVIENERIAGPETEVEPAHVWLGMLHGYPTRAIVDYATRTPFMKLTDIAYAEAHSGDTVNYRHTEPGTSQTTAHCRLWGSILQDVYSEVGSDPASASS